DTAVSRTTAAAAASSRRSSRATRPTAGSARQRKTSDGTRSAGKPGHQPPTKCSSQKCRGPPPRCVDTTWKTWPNENPATRSVSSSSTLSGDHQTVGSARTTTATTPPTTAAGRSARLIRGAGQGLLHLGRDGRHPVRVLVLDVRLV